MAIFFFIIGALLCPYVYAQTAPEVPSAINEPTRYVHFFEVRKSAIEVPVYKNPDKKSKTPYTLRAGDIIRIDLNKEQVLNFQKSAKEENPVWVPLQSGQGYVEYDFKSFMNLPLSNGPPEMNSKVSLKEGVTTIFKKPGHLSWRKCSDTPEVCKAFPSKNAELELESVKFEKAEDKALLFYFVNYRVNDPVTDEVKTGSGWVWSGFLNRRPQVPEISEPQFISSLKKPSTVGMGNEITEALIRKRVMKSAEVKVLLEKQQENTVKQMSVFGSVSKNQFSRWVQPAMPEENSDSPTAKPGQGEDGQREPASVPTQTASGPTLDLGVDFHFVSDLQSVSLSGQEYSGSYSQQSLRLGIGGIMPIFLDLELMGTFFLTTPLSQSDPEVGSLALIDIEQIFMVTTGYSVGTTPVKMGFAGELQLYTSTPFDTGYKALVGGKYAVVIEDPRYFFHGMVGPMINTAAISLGNIELVTRGGYRLDPTRPFQSWSVMGEFRTMNFVTDLGTRDANQTSISFGVHKGF